MLDRRKMDQELAALAVIAQSAPTGHLLRKIDAAVDFNKRYEHIRASADTQDSGASGTLMRHWQTISTGKRRAFCALRPRFFAIPGDSRRKSSSNRCIWEI